MMAWMNTLRETPNGKPFVIRRPLMYAYTFSIFLFAGALVFPMIFIGDVVHNIGDALFVGLIFGACALVVWSLSWRSSVRVSENGITLCNVFFVHEIPWSAVEKFVLSEGIKIELRDGEFVGSVQFGGSLLGAITGYPTYKRSFERLKEAHKAHSKASGGMEARKRTYFSFPWLAAALWYLFFALPAVIHVLL